MKQAKFKRGDKVSYKGHTYTVSSSFPLAGTVFYNLKKEDGSVFHAWADEVKPVPTASAGSWMDAYPIGSKGTIRIDDALDTYEGEYEVVEHAATTIKVKTNDWIVPIGQHAVDVLTPYDGHVKTGELECTCDMFTLMNNGCSCGCFQQEKEAKRA